MQSSRVLTAPNNGKHLVGVNLLQNLAVSYPLDFGFVQQCTCGVVREGVIAESFPQISAKIP